jgi:exodeoxyribonuclease X
VGQPISYAAMAVHHILESDLKDQPFYNEFELPSETTYIIGHNVIMILLQSRDVV